MFEFLTQRVLGTGTLESQRLLVPLTVELPSGQADLATSLSPLLARLGIDARQLSPTAIAVEAFPSFLSERGVQAHTFIQDFFQKAEAGEFATASATPSQDINPVTNAAAEHALRDVLDMMACKAAVKAGDQLSPQQLEGLMALREDVERSSNCPHGRPTSIRLTFKELEKLFGRT